MKITRNDRVTFKVEGDEKFDLDFYRKVFAHVSDWPGSMSVEVSSFEKTIIVRSVTSFHASHGTVTPPSDQSNVVAPKAPLPLGSTVCASCKDPIVPTPNGYIHLIDRGTYDHEAVKFDSKMEPF